MTIESFIQMLTKIHCLKKTLLPLCLLYLSLCGCDEAGVAVERAAVGVLGFQTRVKDPLSFQVHINGELFDQKYPHVKYYQNRMQVRITETISERVVFDGFFPVSTNSTAFSMTVYQHHSGSVPVCILPSEEESLPPAGYGKIAFLYDFPDFPEEIKAVVENTIAGSLTEYEPTDTLIIRKNEFSGFFLARLPRQKTQVKLYTTGDNGRPIGMIHGGSGGEFGTINNDFTLYLANGKMGSMGSLQITLEKAY